MTDNSSTPTPGRASAILQSDGTSGGADNAKPVSWREYAGEAPAFARADSGIPDSLHAEAMRDLRAKGILSGAGERAASNPATAAALEENELAMFELGNPIAEPAHYDLTGHPVEAPPGMEDAAFKFDKWRRAALTAAGLPREIGASVVGIAQDAERRFSGLDAAGRENAARETAATLQRIWGDATPKKVELAQRFVRHLDKRCPGVVAYLELTGVGNDAQMVAQIAAAAERHLARGGTL